MDQQRPFLYLTLFFVGFLIWSTWQEEHAPVPVPSPTTSKTIDSASTSQSTSIPTASSGSTAIDVGKPTATNTNSKLIHVKTDVLDVYINTLGGTIVQADLPTYPISLEEKDKAVRIIDKELQYAAQSGLRHQNVDGQYKSELAPNHFANFSAEKDEYILADGEDQLQVNLHWKNDQGISVGKTFTFKRGEFVVTQTQQLNNQSSANWIGNEYLELTHAEHSRAGNLLSGDIAYVGAAYYPNKYKKVDFGDIEDGDIGDKDISTFTDAEKEERLIKGGWIAMLKHYFISAWVPEKESENNYYSRYSKANENYIIGVKTPVKTINAGASGVFTNQLYIGPTNQSELEKISEGLDLTVDYGIFAFVSKPIFYVMNLINKHIVSNWGWTIILLTLLIKIIFFYPSAVSYRSMAKMKKMAPKIKAIGEKYKNDPQAKQKETMAFYRKEKINPLGGCLPMLIQMPVFMGLYWVLQESVELRQAPWILWYKDLSIKDPTFILPIIMGLSMFVQQKLNPPMVQDPLQQKIFTYLPVVFTVMFLFFPAGLVLYWVVNNILSIVQQYIINKKIIGDT